MTSLKCTHCGNLFPEPEQTYGMNCPKCNHYLVIPSRKDWNELHKIYIELTDNDGKNRKHGFIIEDFDLDSP